MEHIKLIHAIAGIIVGFAGILQILLPKGGKRHRILGNIYFWSWIGIVITGAVIGHIMITFLGILGLYMAYTGYRLGKNKQIAFSKIDKVIITAALCFSFGLLGYGIYFALQQRWLETTIGFFFGIIFLSNTWKDYNRFVREKATGSHPDGSMTWLFEHFGRMYVSYIAAITAFTAIQNIFPIPFLNWTLPTVLGSILIVLSNRHYKKKYRMEN